jgi:hypothetical protein
VLLCAAIVAALVSFIACTAPAADTNEVTPTGTTGAAPTSTSAKTTATVSVSVTSPAEDSRAINIGIGAAELDYYEIYFRRHDWNKTNAYIDGDFAQQPPTVGNNADMEPEEIFFGSGKIGGKAANITLTHIHPEKGTRFDVLLLGGRKETADANRILLAGAFLNTGTEGTSNTDYATTDTVAGASNTRGVLIKLDRVNQITLSPKFFTVWSKLSTSDGNPATTDSASVRAQGYIGQDIAAGTSYYPTMFIGKSVATLQKAGFTLDPEDGWVTSGSAKWGIKSINSQAWMPGKSTAAGGNVALTGGSLDTAVVAWTTDFVFYGPEITFKDGAGDSINDLDTQVLNKVANTYGKIYAHVAFNPFGQTLKGTPWHIQPGLNYQDLSIYTTEDGASATIDGGAVVLRFGDPDSVGIHLPVNTAYETADPPAEPGTTSIDFEGFN